MWTIYHLFGAGPSRKLYCEIYRSTFPDHKLQHKRPRPCCHSGTLSMDLKLFASRSTIRLGSTFSPTPTLMDFWNIHVDVNDGWYALTMPSDSLSSRSPSSACKWYPIRQEESQIRLRKGKGREVERDA